jgi:hypothetical protein
MTRINKPIPPNQSEIIQSTIKPYLNQGKPIVDTVFSRQSNRAQQTSRKTDKIKDISVGLQDIDYAIKYYFDNVIKPSVTIDGQFHPVHVEYASPERWKSVQADGYYRDVNGKVNVPLIIYKRTNVEKNRNLGNKIDGNNASLYQVFETRYNPRNQYDNFSVLTNRVPNKQYYISVVPDYVTVTYDVVVFTNYVEQNNKIIEAIEYASDSYWGDENRWHFRTMLDSLATTTTINTGEDRFAQTSITLRVNGYLIPNSVNAKLSKQSITYSTSQVVFGLEVVGDVNETFNAASQIAASQVAGSTSFIGGGSNITNNVLEFLAQAEADYLAYSSAVKATSTTATTATFTNVNIKQPPAESNIPVPTLNDFQFFANGVAIPRFVLTSFNQVGFDLVLTLVTTGPTGLGYDLVGKEIMVVGKIQS